jgi:hypothetical protein
MEVGTRYYNTENDTDEMLKDKTPFQTLPFIPIFKNSKLL